jgi:hypothetical protein
MLNPDVHTAQRKELIRLRSGRVHGPWGRAPFIVTLSTHGPREAHGQTGGVEGPRMTHADPTVWGRRQSPLQRRDHFFPDPTRRAFYSQTVSLSEDLDSYLFGQDQRESRGDKEMAARQISAHRSEPRLRDSTMHLPNEVVVTMHPPLVAHGELLLALCL